MIKSNYVCVDCNITKEVPFEVGKAPKEVLCDNCNKKMIRKFLTECDTDNISIYNKTTEETRAACDCMLYGSLPSGLTRAAY